MPPVARLVLVVAAAALLVGAAVLQLAGHGRSTTVDVHQVERAFADHGQAFQHEQVAPDVRSLAGLPPDADRHVRAVLSAVSPTTFSGLQVWVFDSPASAGATFGLFRGRVVSDVPPLLQGNLIVIASGDRLAGVHAALADLT